MKLGGTEKILYGSSCGKLISSGDSIPKCFNLSGYCF